METELSGRTAVVTGGTRGIGAGISRTLLAAGAEVISTYGENHAAAEAFKESLEPPVRRRLEVRSCDVTKREAVEALFDELDSRERTVEILINNAGIRRDNIIGMMPEEDWDAVIDTNLKGSYLMSKYAVQRMARARYGRIVMISSAAADYGFPGQSNYGASKAGQIGLMRSLAKEVASRNITVNCVAPGFIATELIDDLDETTKVAYKKIVPVGRFGTVEDVANAALFLSSPAAGYVTGTVINVTGGLV